MRTAVKIAAAAIAAAAVAAAGVFMVMRQEQQQEIQGPQASGIQIWGQIWDQTKAQMSG